MGINIQSIATTIEKFKINSGVERLLPIKPAAFSKINTEGLKVLEKDTFQNMNLSFNQNEIAQLKDQIFTPFMEKFMETLKLEKKFDLNLTKRVSDGYFNSVNHSVELSENILSDPTYGRIVYKNTEKTLFLPRVKNIEYPLTGKKEDLDAIIQSVDGWENVFKAKPFTKSQRIKYVKSVLIHEPIHGKHIENIMKLEGVGINEFVNKMIYSKSAKAELSEEELNKLALEMKDSWKHLENKQNTIPLNSPLGKKTKKIWNHMLKQAETTNLEKKQELYFLAPTEIEAYKVQEKLAKKLGLTLE